MRSIAAALSKKTELRMMMNSNNSSNVEMLFLKGLGDLNYVIPVLKLATCEM